MINRVVKRYVQAARLKKDPDVKRIINKVKKLIPKGVGFTTKNVNTYLTVTDIVDGYGEDPAQYGLPKLTQGVQFTIDFDVENPSLLKTDKVLKPFTVATTYHSKKGKIVPKVKIETNRGDRFLYQDVWSDWEQSLAEAGKQTLVKKSRPVTPYLEDQELWDYVEKHLNRSGFLERALLDGDQLGITFRTDVTPLEYMQESYNDYDYDDNDYEEQYDLVADRYYDSMSRMEQKLSKHVQKTIPNVKVQSTSSDDDGTVYVYVKVPRA